MITVSSPEAPNATTADQFKFDGSESIKVDFTDAGLDYHAAYTPAQYSKLTSTFTGAGGDIASLPLSTWQASGSVFQVFFLQAGTPTNASPAYTQYVKLSQWLSPQPNYADEYQLIGNVTSTANMPVTGTGVFVGQAYGETRNLAAAAGATGPLGYPVQNFTATSTWTVNFAGANTVGQVTGLINNFHVSAGGDPNLASSAITFTLGNIHGNAFTASGTLSGAGFPSGSAVSAIGSFYGPSTNPAAEIGGLFYGQLSNPSGYLLGGFVGKR